MESRLLHSSLTCALLGGSGACLPHARPLPARGNTRYFLVERPSGAHFARALCHTVGAELLTAKKDAVGGGGDGGSGGKDGGGSVDVSGTPHSKESGNKNRRSVKSVGEGEGGGKDNVNRNWRIDRSAVVDGVLVEVEGHPHGEDTKIWRSDGSDEKTGTPINDAMAEKNGASNDKDNKNNKRRKRDKESDRDERRTSSDVKRKDKSFKKRRRGRDNAGKANRRHVDTAKNEHNHQKTDFKDFHNGNRFQKGASKAKSITGSRLVYDADWRHLKDVPSLRQTLHDGIWVMDVSKATTTTKMTTIATMTTSTETPLKPSARGMPGIMKTKDRNCREVVEWEGSLFLRWIPCDTVRTFVCKFKTFKKKLL